MKLSFPLYVDFSSNCSRVKCGDTNTRGKCDKFESPIQISPPVTHMRDVSARARLSLIKAAISALTKSLMAIFRERRILGQSNKYIKILKMIN